MSAIGWAVVAVVLLATGAAWAAMAARLERLARAAHDLRVPLTAARLALHSAGRDRGWGRLAPVDQELARAALALDDLETARRGRRVALRSEPLAVIEVLRQVQATWSPLAWPVGRDVRIEGGVPPGTGGPRVQGDRLRLAMALGNLVGNALEHGSGTIRLRCRTAMVDGALRVRFEVEDAGPGLPASVPALARRRWASAGTGSRGRGLAIAREAARRHGGTVHDERIPGGCRLVLELPGLAAPPHPAAPDAPAPADPALPAVPARAVRAPADPAPADVHAPADPAAHRPSTAQPDPSVPPARPLVRRLGGAARPRMRRADR